MFVILIIVSYLFCPNVLFAEPVGGFGVNEESKECCSFFLGDECSKCDLPPGWKKVKECPSDYKRIKDHKISRPTKCKPLKNPFCCTVHHSGGRGDCDDVVVNNKEKKCAFVEDITSCQSLPPGWEKPESLDSWGNKCPSVEYEWTDNYLECEE